MDENMTWLANVLGLVVNTQGLPTTISTSRRDPTRARIEVHSVRTAVKRGALGLPEPLIVVVLTQRRAGFFDEAKQAAMDKSPYAWDDGGLDFKYRAGCTLLIDPEQMQIRRVIRTPGNIASDGELKRMRRYLLDGLTPPNAFAGSAMRLGDAEPFAFLHSHVG
jgi:hypothetical protein